MGRPRLSEEQRPVCQTIRLKPATADAVSRYALKHHISVYRLLGNVIDRVFAKWIIQPSTVLVYSQTHHVTVQVFRRAVGSSVSSSQSDLRLDTSG